MLIEKIQLWNERNDVNLYAYLHSDSKEYSKNKKRPAVIICPGGGYVITSDCEAEPVAIKFAAAGYQAFILRYSTYFSNGVVDFKKPAVANKKVAYPEPLYDLAKAIITIRENSLQWLIDPDKITICGFSAGGHLAASLGVHWQADFLQEKFEVASETLKPNAMILSYPLLDFELMLSMAEPGNLFTAKFRELSNMAVFGAAVPDKATMEKVNTVNSVTSQTPPTFMWHTADDKQVTVANSLNFASALNKHQVPFELHVFESGVHASSLCDETAAADSSHINPHCQVWFDLALKWLKKNNLSLQWQETKQ
ncbi:MAG: xynB1 [Firmicutes bacterium]|nr:xynB1 [Bacillota bacterium]